VSAVVGKNIKTGLKRNCRRKQIPSVKKLANLLASFGIQTKSRGLSLDWGSPDESQFDLLLKLMSQLTNTNLYGSYHSGEWIISA
jgi:hypothetical protein